MADRDLAYLFELYDDDAAAAWVESRQGVWLSGLYQHHMMILAERGLVGQWCPWPKWPKWRHKAYFYGERAVRPNGGRWETEPTTAPRTR
jgi:hypothetical protein